MPAEKNAAIGGGCFLSVGVVPLVTLSSAIAVLTLTSPRGSDTLLKVATKIIF